MNKKMASSHAAPAQSEEEYLMSTATQLAMSKAKQAYYQLRQNGQVPRGMLPTLIEQSWQRCLLHGAPEGNLSFEPGSREELQEEHEKHSLLLDHAMPVMETLYEQIVDSQSMVLLTNSNGYILHSLGDDEFLARARRIALAPGVSWSEEGRGTNAIGTALVEERPVVVHGHQHFASANHFLTCSASPIQDPYGRIVGVLDVTGDHRGYSPHTLALVKMSVRLVENQMFSSAFPDALLVHFHTRPEYLGTLCEGMMAFSPDGRALSANRNACVQLGLSLAEVAACSFEELFRQPVRAALDHAMLHGGTALPLTTLRGLKLFARVIPGQTMKAPLRVFTYPKADESAAPRAGSGATARGPRVSALERLDTGDPAVHLVIDKVRRVLGKDIPILIHGETGAGKELLARAIHDDGPRHDKPFVAVNCAAIPEGLIESELFGYEEGAFTGAKRKGNLGKLLQADGGTLFLDEIGDMPQPLQARLLRVLQERVVNPLGSNKAIPVDVHLVCATHRRLKDWVAAGKFREDLYYRLNGLTVNLPALRARNDLAALIDLILVRVAPAGKVPQVAPEVMELFLRHPWPGNIRQLSNLLRTALVMADEDDMIGLVHLPDDFLEEFEAINVRGASPVGADDPEVQPAAVSQPASAAAAPFRPQPQQEPFGRSAAPAASDLETNTLTLIQRTLEQHSGNVSAAARQLGISRNTLYRKLRQIWQL